jgi:host factor-I protein
VPVTIYILGGVKLTGVVRGFDAFTILHESPGRPAELVYKHAVCAILPSKDLTNSGLAVVRERSKEATEQEA